LQYDIGHSATNMFTVEAEAAQAQSIGGETLKDTSLCSSSETLPTNPNFDKDEEASTGVEPCVDEEAISSQVQRASLSPEISTTPPIPDPLESPKYAKIRYTIFTIYHRLFSIVFLANLAVFIAVVIKDRTLTDYVNAAAANLLGVGLARQPLMVNFIFKCACCLPTSAPLRLRRLAAKIFHYGGIHSGCGVAAVMWYIAFVGILTKDATTSATARLASPAILVIAWLILALLLAIVIAAYPTFRFKRHDYFELTHRFSGWLTIALFWPLLLLYVDKTRQAEHQSFGITLFKLPAFWILVFLTLSIIHPWIYLRKVPVTPEYISPYAIRLHFNFTTIKFGQAFAISKHPLRDWHGFAQFRDLEGPDKFSCLVSKAGDWTSDCIARPPTHVWKRGVPAFGVGYVMKMFRSFIMVTTGSGIGPCLSFLALEDRPPLRVIWQTRSPLKTYGQGVLDSVKVLDPDPIVLDTTTTGRQDMFPMVWDLIKKFKPEAVLVVSNPVFTRKMVFDLESRGVPAYGPIFDS
jgi:hypothetical protein